MAETQLENLSAISKSSGEAFILLSRDAEVSSWNPAARSLFGYSEKEVLGRDSALLLGPKGTSKLHAGLARLSEGGRAERFESFARLKDDRRMKALITLSPVHDDRGSFLGATLVIRPASHRALPDSDQACFFAIIVEAHRSAKRPSSQAVFATWNAGAERLFGYADYEVVGHDVSMLVCPDQSSKLRQAIQRVLQGDQVDDCTCLRLDKAGDWIGTTATLAPVRNEVGRVVGVSGRVRSLALATEPSHNGATGRVVSRGTKMTDTVDEAATVLRRAVVQGSFPFPETSDPASHWLQAFDLSPIPTAIITTKQRVVRVNNAYAQMLGYPPEFLVSLSSLTDVTLPDDRGRDEKLARELLAGARQSYELEKQYVRADGHLVPVRHFVSAIRDESGSLVAMLAQAVDLTLQRRADAEHLHLQRVSELAFDQSPIATAIIGLDRRPLWVNDTYFRLLGYPHEKLLDFEAFVEITDPGDVPHDNQLWGELLAGVRQSFWIEKRYVHADGHAVPVRVSVTALCDESGSLTSFLAQAIDLTEQERAEAERRSAARLTQLLFEQSSVAAGAVDPRGRILTVNETLLRMSGYSREELIGSPLVEHVHPDDVDVLAHMLSEYNAGRVDQHKVEVRLHDADGHFLPTRIYSAALRDDSGSFIGVLGQVIDLTEQKQAEHLLRRTFDQSPIPSATMDLQGRIEQVNEAAARLFGYSREELVGSLFADHTHPDEVDVHRDALAKLIAGTRDHYEIGRRLVHADGHFVPGRMYVAPVHDESGAVAEVIGQFIDESQLRRAETERERATRFAHLLFEQSPIPAATIDLDERFQVANDAFLEVLGCARDELVGSKITEHIPPDEVVEFSAVFAEMASGAQERSMSERRFLHADGHVLPGRLYATTIRDDAGTTVAFLGQFLDQSELWRVEEQLEYEELHDQLTSLPSRRLVADRVGRELEWARARHRLVGVTIIDVDRFDAVNEAFGRALGDQLLVELAQRLAACTRHTDTVGRLEGDTFAVVRGALTDPLEMIDLAHSIAAMVEKPFALDSEQELVTVSIGVAISSRDETSERLVRDAELALTKAKEDGGNCWVVFDDTLRVRAQTRAAAEAGLRTALQNGEFILHYQPIVDLQVGRFVGVEALIRWNDPARGTVPPDEFIPISEQTGLIVPIGEWVMGEACRQASAWNQERVGDTPWQMAVNVSPLQIRSGTLFETVAQALDASGLDPTTLTLELTETAFMEDVDLVHNMLDPLHERGVQIAIDDFGTGYSSLGRIRRFQVDVLKIDRSFISGLENDQSARQLATAILEMGRALDVLVIAEGVETQAQLEWLGRFGCRCAQGFLFARPMPAPECLAQLRQT